MSCNPNALSDLATRLKSPLDDEWEQFRRDTAKEQAIRELPIGPQMDAETIKWREFQRTHRTEEILGGGNI